MEKWVSGKKLLPALGVGCLFFAAVMGLGVYYFAQATTPYFKKKAEEARRGR
jgi:hypothetical protein